jgi:hypothetical protein
MISSSTKAGSGKPPSPISQTTAYVRLTIRKGREMLNS